MDAVTTYQTYRREDVWSDVKEHLHFLCKEAASAKFVLELGVRNGISTAALLNGVKVNGGHVWSVDKESCDVYPGDPDWTFIQADSCDKQTLIASGVPKELDFLFIDTEHTEERTSKELKLYVPMVKSGGKVALHDVYDMSTFPGVLSAVAEYCNEHDLEFRVYPKSYGLAVIEVV